MNSPMGSQTLRDEIAAQLRREIACGRLADGEELTQERVSAALEVSRIPVREAFLQLENEGVLRRLPNRHIQVVGTTPQRRRQGLEFLAAVECEIVRLNPEGPDVEELEGQLTGCRRALEAGNLEELYRWDDQFHLALGHGLDHPAILQFHAVGRRGLLEAAAAPLPGETLLALDQAILAACGQDRETLCQQIQRYYLAYTEVSYP